MLTLILKKKKMWRANMFFMTTFIMLQTKEMESVIWKRFQMSTH